MGLKYTKLSEVSEAGPCPILMDHIHNGVMKYNSKALSNPQKVHKVGLLPHSFSILTGELGEVDILDMDFGFNLYFGFHRKHYESEEELRGGEI